MEPRFTTVSRPTDEYGTIDLNVAVTGDDAAPLILCVHGWPEIWHSWRFQMEHFAERGFRVAAMDVRGYGWSSRPEPIAAYRISELAADAAAVARALSPDAPSILFGHDWGAPVAWNTARLHADTVRAVAGMSVPYRPATAGNPMELWDLLYPDSYFYMKYFQEVGVAEAAFMEDLPAAIRMTYYAASGDSSNDLWLSEKPADHAFLDGLIDPDPAPEWMAGDALTPTIEAHQAGPMHGAFHRYRAQHLDGADIEPVGEPVLAQPTCFIGGERDIVRSFVPGMDMFGNPGEFCSDYRGTTIVDEAGHWVQQEKPAETNAALDAFVDSL